MKRLFSILVLSGLFVLSTNTVNAKTGAAAVVSNLSATVATTAVVLQDEVPSSADKGFTQVLKEKFIEGGAAFMGIVLLCLILGLAVAIERIIYLNLASTNSAKLKQRVEDALASGGVEAAKEVCRNTKGPVASIYYQGLDRAGESLEAAEKAVVAYGGVQMGQLEKNLSASLIAGDIQVALLTTVFGLIVAIILQVFYNYIIAKIDSIINDMEDSSIALIDMLVEYKK
jgi:biopolymer transport protein ExbB